MTPSHSNPATSDTNSQKLAGKVAIVTGGSKGIGLAIARSLGEMGAKVSICARDKSKLNQTAEELRKAGIDILAVPADVTRPKDIAALVETTDKKLGPIDILINNAGIGHFGPVHNMSEEDYDSILDTNLKSVFLMTKAVAPGMIERGRGQIVNIASLAGKNAILGGSIYCASKWGLLGFTKSAAEDLRGYGIRVSAVCPGSVVTEFSPHTGRDSSKMLQPEDVAHAVAALVTEDPRSFISEIEIRPARKP
jgi:NAD(P)-dependent dehydrogenase (short-subunit alcohol dehydrogenase family)